MAKTFGIFLFFLIVGTATGVAQNISSVNEKTEKLVAKFMIKEDIPGMAISISLNDSLIFTQGFGFSDIGSKRPVNPSETKFRIASITKTMTATVIYKLRENGQIDLQKSANFYLDSLPRKEFLFTIEQLGGHLSGLPRMPSTEKYSCNNTYKRGDFYLIFEKDALQFAPSTKMQYSNYGYKLLGVIIEKVTGKSIVENHKKYVIDVLDLKNTIPETKIRNANTATFYIKKDKSIIEAPCLDCTFKYAPGCYLSTSEDLVKLGNAYLYAGKILEKESLVDMIKSKRLTNNSKTKYGFGFATCDDIFGTYSYGHDGGYEGSRSALRIYPNSRIVISVLVNRDVENIADFVAAVADNYNALLKTR